MRHIKLAVVLLLIAPAAHAQWVVTDPALESSSLAEFGKEALTELHTAQDVINTANTVVQVTSVLNAVAHGNVMGLMQLAPLLGNPCASNPLSALGVDTSGPGIGAAMSGLSTLGSVGGAAGNLTGSALNLYNNAKSQTQIYTPPNATDFNAWRMMQQGQALASQMALSQQSMSGSQMRLAGMPSLLTGTQTAGDVKSAVDASNTIAVQGVTQQAQTNQLLAMQIMQQANAQNQQNLIEQDHRRSADAWVAAENRAAANSAAGQINFITQ